jgi:hypothetical protein
MRTHSFCWWIVLIQPDCNDRSWLYSDSESGQRGGPFTSQLQTLRWECRLFQGLGLLYRRLETFGRGPGLVRD